MITWIFVGVGLMVVVGLFKFLLPWIEEAKKEGIINNDYIDCNNCLCRWCGDYSCLRRRCTPCDKNKTTKGTKNNIEVK